MTGNRDPGSAYPVHIGCWRTRPPTTAHLVPGATILRRSGSASRPRPLARVDLRSSLDPDPSPAFVRTEPGNRQNRVKHSAPWALTGPAPSGMTAWSSATTRERRRTVCGIRGHVSLCSFLRRRSGPAGRLDKAQYALERMLTYANHVGLYSEEIDPRGRQIPTSPRRSPTWHAPRRHRPQCRPQHRRRTGIPGPGWTRPTDRTQPGRRTGASPLRRIGQRTRP
jgi:hypothetical protein